MSRGALARDGMRDGTLSARDGERIGMERDGMGGGATHHSSLITHHSRVGFLTDTTLCIGCKACEVACKQWNQLPMDDFGFTGFSYDNTGDLGATTWRHVAFVERIGDDDGRRPTSLRPF